MRQQGALLPLQASARPRASKARPRRLKNWNELFALELFVCAAEQPLDIPAHVAARDPPSPLDQPRVLFGQQPGEERPAVPPFIDQLVVQLGGGGCECELRAEELEAGSRALGDEGGQAGVPPAAPQMHVCEPRRDDSGQVLLRGVQDCEKEFGRGMAGAQARNGAEMRGAGAVAGHPQRGVHPPPRAHAQQEGHAQPSA
eukprot:scaffold11371_cov112-Isochrysis_galbana.AAC.7